MILTELQIAHILDLAKAPSVAVNRNFRLDDDEPGLAFEVDTFREALRLAVALVKALGKEGDRMIREVKTLHGSLFVLYFPGVKVKAGR